MPTSERLDAVFFRLESGSEPVREWLKSLPKDERRAIGEDIAYVQFKWPIGKPRVDHLRGAVWEVRTSLAKRIARTLFAVEGRQMVLLHGVPVHLRAARNRRILGRPIDSHATAHSQSVRSDLSLRGRPRPNEN